MRRLESSGVDRRRSYLNFEDDRLLPIQLPELDLILRAHDELYPEVSGRRRYLFFDEVQGVPSWETYLRRLHDTEDARLFVTGSSSHLLSRELATGLRGRSISFEVFPLSFAEFLRFRGLEHTPYSRVSESRMASALEEYLKTGGLPEVVLADESMRPRILKEYRRPGVLPGSRRTLQGRQSARHAAVAPAMSGSPRLALQRPQTLSGLSFQGQALSKDTLYNYLSYFEQSLVVFRCRWRSVRLRKQAVKHRKKLHAIDWALAYPFVAEPTIDVGKKLEAAVFLHWRRQREDLGLVWRKRARLTWSLTGTAPNN